jgi:hypothetical protein
MTDTKKKGKTQPAVIAILFLVLMGNFARQSHTEIRGVDFVQILGMGMLLGVLLMSVLRRPKSN